MKKKLFIIISIVIGIMTSELSAQQMSIENDYVVIDCTTMPVNARRDAVHTSGPLSEHNEQSELNRVPYKKFAISKTDINSAGSSGSESMNYAAAVSACNAYGGPSGNEAGKWRLPNQREAMLVMTFKNKMEMLSIFSSSNNNLYWCSTKYSSTTQIWCYFYENTRFQANNNSNTYYVRCVREFE